MDITGRLIKILPEQRGESQRGAWVRGGFVIETEDNYPKQIAFTLFGEDRLAMITNIPLNSSIIATFSPESREYNERWYTDLRCIRVQPFVAGQMPTAQSVGNTQQPVASTPAFAQAPAAMPDNSNDDLPF